MATQKQIDEAVALLSPNHFILPIPTGLSNDPNLSDKVLLATLIADQNGYKPTTTKINSGLTFSGSEEDFNLEVTPGKFMVFDKIDNGDGTFKYTYETYEEIPSPKTKVEYGLNIAARKLGDLTKQTIKIASMQAIREAADLQIQQAEEQVDLSLTILDSVKAL